MFIKLGDLVRCKSQQKENTGQVQKAETDGVYRIESQGIYVFSLHTDRGKEWRVRNGGTKD